MSINSWVAVANAGWNAGWGTHKSEDGVDSNNVGSFPPLGSPFCALDTDNLQQLKNDFDKLIIFFTLKKFDPYEEFEKSKALNFKYSSKLEGIDIQDSNQTRDELIKKHKVI